MSSSELKNCAYIEISSWIGYSHDAVHVYAKLVVDSDRIEIETPLNQKEVNYLNRKENYEAYKKGDLSTRFRSEKDVVSTVLKSYLTKNIDFIMLGSPIIAEPQKIVYVRNNKFDIEVANDIWKEFDPLDWDENEKEKELLWERWFKYVKRSN